MAEPLIIAHRGASFDAPENTRAAYRLAWAQSADGAEGDFQLTRDGRIVCMHDLTTGRTAHTDLLVSQSTLAELRKLDVGRWKDARFAGEGVPTLEEVLELVPAGKLFFIEIKCGTEILPVLREVITRCDVSQEQLRILCFDAEVIGAAQEVLPAIKGHWLVEYSSDRVTGAKTPTPEMIWETLGRIGARGLNSQADDVVLGTELVGRLKRAGYEVATWTVDDPSLAARLIEAGVEMITTNRPRWMREKCLQSAKQPGL